MFDDLRRRFGRDRAGNIALFTGMLSLPLAMGVGLAIDVATIERARSRLQQATDAAVLSIAREGETISNARAKELAHMFLSENFDVAHADMSLDRTGTRFDLGTTSQTPLAFGGLFGYATWPVEANASADVAYANYEIALVLDTTGSMAGGKLAAMKDAVDGMIETMASQVAEERLRFALVPFATFVNVGPSRGPAFDEDGRQLEGTGADWLDLAGASEVPQTELSAGASRFQIYRNLGQEWAGCVETRDPRSGGDVSDLAPDPRNPATLFVPGFGIDEPDTADFANSYIASGVNPRDDTVAARRLKFAKYGVATDAAGRPLDGGLLSDVSDVLAGLTGGGGEDDEDDEDDEDEDGGRGGSGVRAIRIDTGPSPLDGKPKGPNHGCDVHPIMPLGNDTDAIRDAVESLAASGTTNIMEGVAWGMRVLSPGRPFAQGAADKTGMEKIMVVLTDGSNVFGNRNNSLGSSYSSNGYLIDGRLGIRTGSGSSTNGIMNDKTLEACDNAKAQGIEIFTIRLEEPNVATGNMLAQCATSAAHFFDAPSRNQLDEVFERIRDSIVRIRISS